jgi:hypothetical protein
MIITRYLINPCFRNAEHVNIYEWHFMLDLPLACFHVAERSFRLAWREAFINKFIA